MSIPPTARRIGVAPVTWMSGKFGRGGADSQAVNTKIATIGERRRNRFIARASSKSAGHRRARLACGTLAVHQGMHLGVVEAIARTAELAGHHDVAVLARERAEL